MKYFMVYVMPYHSHEWILNEPEFQILLACQGHCLSTTNSDIKRVSKVDMNAADIGIIMARLRMVKLIDYAHIETGRKAVGSGRYELQYQADPFSMEPVLKTMAHRLPPLPLRHRYGCP